MRSFRFLIAATAALVTHALPHLNATHLAARQASSILVFCHFMIGIVSDRTGPAAYDDDMMLAKAAGIDAFALNIGVDPYTDTQLDFAYDAAATHGMKVFLSFDFNWWSTAQGAAVGAKIAQYAGRPAQLFVGGRVFASSFAGDGVDVGALRAAAGRGVYWAPNFHPGRGNFGAVDAALNWMAWENNGNNKAPSGGAAVTVHSGDQSYRGALAGKGYIAPVSPWFSTHFGPEVPYSKNWVFPSDLLWYMRWLDILATQPTFVEIVTWNDYGESHYVGPLSSPHTDDGASKWVNDMPHDGWLEMAKPFIQAYKAGAPSATRFIASDQLVYWYRVAPKSLNCDATDTTTQPANNASGNYFRGRPDGWQTLADAVFVVALLTAPGTVVVNSGGTAYAYDAPAGASAAAVPLRVGAQAFALMRGGATVLAATSLHAVQDACPCGLYNFNAYVGTVPPRAGARDALQADGLAAFARGLRMPDGACTITRGAPIAARTDGARGARGGGGRRACVCTARAIVESAQRWRMTRVEHAAAEDAE
ncbi:putative alpha-1,3-glucanase/mutanase [Mycena pura]|uniref:Alpha-1,3-glucanase/mutanase n=1 Tax=Mycena pura TaxID=153505 RepID=A0AAD6YUX1_9AGAR|nr:putative alpha-1,3-glucanase/mutanase [Mycena pura]